MKEQKFQIMIKLISLQLLLNANWNISTDLIFIPIEAIYLSSQSLIHRLKIFCNVISLSITRISLCAFFFKAMVSLFNLWNLKSLVTFIR